MLPSWLLLVFIAFGGAVAVICTTLYPFAKQQEQSSIAATKVRQLLKPEIIGNRNTLKTIAAEPPAGKSYIWSLQVSAWQTVSSGELIINLEPDELSETLQIYDLTNQANELQLRITELSVGPSSALTSAENNRRTFRQMQKQILNKLSAVYSNSKYWN